MHLFCFFFFCLDTAINTNILTIAVVEKKLDDALCEGDFDLIQENVTPKTLTSCKTNALLKAFQVSCLLVHLGRF